jgi:hypothetical protein
MEMSGTTPVSLVDVSLFPNFVSGGSGGSNTCTPGHFTCFGAAGYGGFGGLGLGGTNGVDGEGGDDGMEGAIGLGTEPNCQAAGETCVVPEPTASTLGLAALATCAALRRRSPRSGR